MRMGGRMDRGGKERAGVWRGLGKWGGVKV